MHTTYVRFLNLIKAVKEATPEWPYLDAVEDHLLDQLAMCWVSKKPVTAFEAVQLMPCLSQSTVHTKLQNLIKKGIVELVQDPADRRVKHVRATTITVNYFTNIESQLK